MKNFRIGTMVRAGANSGNYIREIIPYGFECFALTYPSGSYQGVSPEEVAEKVMPELEGKDIEISSISVFGNPLMDTELAEETRKCFRHAIETAHLFGTNLVTGFTGSLVGKKLPESIERFKEVWTPMTEFAASKGVRIAFENCNMGGNWNSTTYNMALNPDAWELLFEVVPAENIGLEWEPCHQMCQFIDPMPQIGEWSKRIFHIHGKDLTFRKDILAKHGNLGKVPFMWHRTPGFGDSNWADIISELRKYGYEGNIDIEGWHDPVYRGELEMAGQVAGLNYLKRCRGDKFVPNPAE